MSMKYFTLSAICVLAFGMLLALSGATDLAPGYQQQKTVLTDPGSSYRPSHDKPTPAVNAELPLTPPRSNVATTVLPSWKKAHVRDKATFMGIVKRISSSARLKAVGLLFVVGWVLLSVKTLSSG